MYSIVIQLGAILAVLVYFRGRIANFIHTFPRGEKGDRNALTHPLSLTMIAFVITAGPAFAMTKLIGKNLEDIHVMASALLVGGVVMWLVDFLCRQPRITHIEEMRAPHAVWIGAVQILSAVFPGTSRSMCTIAAGQVAGMSRASALEFSFFLSIPTMIVATGFQLASSLLPHRGKAADSRVDEQPCVAGSRHRVHRFLRGRARSGRLVHALGQAARVRAVRHLPHRAGLRAFHFFLRACLKNRCCSRWSVTPAKLPLYAATPRHPASQRPATTTG